MAAVALTGALLVGGCGQSADQARVDRAARQARRQQVQQQAAQPAVPTDADFVSAVAGAGGAQIIDLKFRLASRPEIGKPVTVELRLLPESALVDAKLVVSLHGDDGLDVRLADRLQQFTITEAGAPVHASVEVTPARPGVYNLSATVLVESTASSFSRNYNIPFIAI